MPNIYDYTEYHLGVKLVIQEMVVRYYDYHGALCNRADYEEAQRIGHEGFRRDAQWRNHGNGMTVEDTVELGSRDFMGVMGVLAEMHKAMQSLRTER